MLLITSRRRKRWIVPKGLIEDGYSAEASAAKEAWEEAGVRGDVLRPALGTWTYAKWGGLCEVEVFPLEVRQCLDAWPEDDRARRWLPARLAARAVTSPDLAALLRCLRDRLR